MSGCARTAHHTTAARYTTGSLRTTSMKIASQTETDTKKPV
jgi:hypothetical protein